MTKLLAIDPGSHKCGYAWFKDGKLICTGTKCSTSDTPLKRRLEIGAELCDMINEADTVTSEEPLLLGRNNTGMQRLLGYIEFLTNGKVKMFHPMTIKKVMQSGSSDKLDIALAAGELVKSEDEQNMIADAISREAFDETDAVCVGLTYLKGLET